jgi:hypothetical protein
MAEFVKIRGKGETAAYVNLDKVWKVEGGDKGLTIYGPNGAVETVSSECRIDFFKRMKVVP